LEDRKMLVLSRKQGEEIVIDGNVRVRVIEVTGTRVKLAFHAPADVPIHRSEVAETLAADRPTGDEYSVLFIGG
jgi:carbon storage regulator